MKRSLLIALLFLFAIQLQAQENRRERIKSLKIAYLTEKLDLQPEEAAAFWPAYNQYEDKVFELKASLGKTLRKVAQQESNALSDAEATEALKQVIALREEIAKTELLFQRDIPTVIGAKKALYLNIYEERFKRELLKKLQDRRTGQRNN